MIRINLLAERKAPRGAAGGPVSGAGGGMTETSSGSLQTAVLALILIGSLTTFGGAFYWVKHTVADLQDKNTKADEELARLSEIRKKMDEFTRQKDLLERKVNLITELKKNQEVPVHLLDQISKSVPDFLWLENLHQEGPNHLTLNGKATTYNAVADFYNRLAQSGWFANVTQGKVFEVPDGVSFTMTCDFVSTKIKEPEKQG
jgi:type IV pilus assembly protein PilN